jgi:hypothetical protein
MLPCNPFIVVSLVNVAYCAFVMLLPGLRHDLGFLRGRWRSVDKGDAFKLSLGIDA